MKAETAQYLDGSIRFTFTEIDHKTLSKIIIDESIAPQTEALKIVFGDKVVLPYRGKDWLIILTLGGEDKYGVFFPAKDAMTMGEQAVEDFLYSDAEALNYVKGAIVSVTEFVAKDPLEARLLKHYDRFTALMT